MSKIKKILALVLCALLVVGVLAACSGNGGQQGGGGEGQETTPAESGEGGGEQAGEKTLVVGYSPFSNKFSPFFSETAYDQDVYAMTQLGLLSSDRQGAIIYKGIDGETINYNGTDYTYYGPANLVVTENEDGTVFYDFELRQDLVFSDGEPLTVDDIIFTMYVLSDPSYDGSSTFFALPIEGMADYRSDMKSLAELIFNAGRDNADFTLFTEEQQTKFWGFYDNVTKVLAEEIVAYCVNNGYNEEGDIAGAAGNWGFSIEDNTIEAFQKALADAYGADLNSMVNTEAATGESLDAFAELDYAKEYMQNMVVVADPVANITGIQKIDDYHMRVVLTEVDATAIYQFTVSIAPLHYYGDKAAFNVEENNFGFPKGDLSSVRAKTTQPMGAGPYKFIKFENGVVNFEANESYYLGAPKTKYVNFQELLSDDDKLNGVTTGTIDITDPSFSQDTIAAIEKANGGELTGAKVTTNTVDNLGYGYIGMCAKVMNVGGDPASDASKNLRRAFGTIFSVYRNVAIDTYYGDRASVINYPISNTSWAAPQSTDDGYKVAFSTDVNGNDIYTSDMTDEQRYEAALQAALGFLEAAGYTVTDGKVTAAPQGASLEYEAWIPGDGTGDHPSFMILTEAAKAFEQIGITLKVKDLTNSSELWTALEAQQLAIWCAAWGASVDPDMYQIYFSGDGQRAAGGSNYMYAIDDPELNQLILDGRTSTDQAYRKTIYKAALDKVIDWAVEIPVYQRQNAIIFSTERVNMDTVTPDITTFYGWMQEIQNIELN